MYRDRAFPCPQCGLDLVPHATRETRSCGLCGGILVPFAELPNDAGPLAQILVEEPATSTTTRRCPICREPLTKIELVPLVLERCDADRVVWFDRTELPALAASLAAFE